jgi:hypothetical protein
MSFGADRHVPAGMTGVDPLLATAENYRRFARWEAAGRSPAYEKLAYAVADDGLVLAFLGGLDRLKRQPNLLFGAARYLLGTPADPRSLRALVANRPEELAEVMNSRRTQTNEPARCAVLLPALAMLPGPLALLEVGAAAGLTLLPDLYSYDYGDSRLRGRDPQAPLLTCRCSGRVPLPCEVPEVVWRAGIDLNPLDVRADGDLAWLECLIWPGEEGRVERLHAAAAVARGHPPPVHRGDLLDDLPRVAALAPAGATLVIYHTAVLAYVEEKKRRAFGTAVAQLGAVWLSNEGAGVLDGVVSDSRSGGFLLVRDGSELLAHTDPHGTWIDWITADDPSPAATDSASA